MTKAHFYCFFLHQTQSKRDSNVLEKAWRTSFIISLVLDTPAHLSRREVGRGGGLAASYTQTSTDPDSSLLSSCNCVIRTCLVSLYPQQSVWMHRTGQNRWQNPGPACGTAGINLLVSEGVSWGELCSDWFWCARGYGSYGWQW